MEQPNPLDQLFDRAKANRVPMAEICRRVDPPIAETTPSRWRRGKNGATLDKVAKLNDALSEILAAPAEQSEQQGIAA